VSFLLYPFELPSNKNHQETAEGFNASLVLQYYARIRLTMSLLPLLQNSISPRVLSIFAAGNEGLVDRTDLSLERNYFVNNIPVYATMTTLAFEELAKSYPTVSFIHSHPGSVRTKILYHFLDSVPGLWWYPAQFLSWTLLPLLLRLVGITAEEAGERQLFLATSSRFPATKVDRIAGKLDGWVAVPL
jgi:hypothetical protein